MEDSPPGTPWAAAADQACEIKEPLAVAIRATAGAR